MEYMTVAQLRAVLDTVADTVLVGAYCCSGGTHIVRESDTPHVIRVKVTPGDKRKQGVLVLSPDTNTTTGWD